LARRRSGHRIPPAAAARGKKDRREHPSLHPDGEPIALAAASAAQTAAKRDKVVFVFNFFDELRRLAPVKK
jgi:hypothetical protein